MGSLWQWRAAHDTAARGDGESVTRRGVNDAAAPGPKDESGTPDKKTEEIISKAGKTQGAKRPA